VTWYRSLYWRIALGVVGFLAAMLIVQAMLFVWAVSQSGRSLPGQSPVRFGLTIALDLASVLERDPQTDLARYVHDQYAQYTHPFFVMLVDGTLITSGSSTSPILCWEWLARRYSAGPSVHRDAAASGLRVRASSVRCFQDRPTDSTAPDAAARPPAFHLAAAIASCARRRSSPAAGSPASSSCRRRRRSDSCSAVSRRCSRWSPPAC
jgi:hypothetical protein